MRESHSHEVPESSQDQRAGPTGLRAWEEAGEELPFSGSGFHFAATKRHGDEWWHNNVGVFNTTEPCTSLAVQWSGRGAFMAGV